ncbi:hypothetical protein NLU13_9198 [Sarocladium strictum]|uniref:Uncharacterized protein n=1 Tax=Sarocladium strictum TaxID=5046 RepID=A0AA39L450_SARSR|nr:hypothetical protein NLU13_9198 [Sarocladium strictum]
MADETTRTIRQAALSPSVEPGGSVDDIDQPSPDSVTTTTQLTGSAAQEAPMQGPTTSPVPDEAQKDPTEFADRHSSASSNEALSKRIRIVHKHWERVCHAVPKCDACGKKGGQVGILQRCRSCTKQLCKACVDNGALEPQKDSAYPTVHIMNPEEIDWSPATREEKAAQANQKRSKKAAGSGGTSTKAKGKAKPTALKGVGLRKIPTRKTTGEPVTEEVPVPEPAVSDGIGNPSHHGSPDPSAIHRARKRALSPASTAMVSQGTEKHARLVDTTETASVSLPINNLAPLRPIMEPNPALILPSLSHIGYHDLRHERHAAQVAARPAAQEPDRPVHHFLGYSRAQFGPRTPHIGPLMDHRSHHEDERFSMPETAADWRRGPSGARLQQGAPAYVEEHHAPYVGRSESRVTGYPPAPRPSQSFATHPHLQPPAHQHHHLPTPYPNIQELATELYRDVHKTRTDYGWPLPTCLVHEISRSWSRGILHRLAAAMGPADAGLDLLHSVAECVSEWLGLRDDPELSDWLSGERDWLRRTERWTGQANRPAM